MHAINRQFTVTRRKAGADKWRFLPGYGGMASRGSLPLLRRYGGQGDAAGSNFLIYCEEIAALRSQWREVARARCVSPQLASALQHLPVTTATRRTQFVSVLCGMSPA